MNWMLCASGCISLSIIAPIASISASGLSAWYTISSIEQIKIYSRECGFADLLIWFPDEGYRDRWTEMEIKSLLAVNKTLEARCADE